MRQRTSFIDQLDRMTDVNECLQLYSGGLDSRYFLLEAERMGISVVALRILLGAEDPAEVAASADAARRAGAEYMEIDCKNLFADRFISSAIRFNARYGNQYPVCSSLSRPLMSAKAVEIARQRRIECIVHNATWVQNSAQRFNRAIRALAPEIRIAVPFIRSKIDRQAKIRALENAGIPLPSIGIHSVDANLWGRVIEAGCLDDPSFPVPEEVFQWTKATPVIAEQQPTSARLKFREGLPVALNDAPICLASLVEELNTLGGRYGVGRYNGLEDTSPSLGGVKNHEVREAPAACAIIEAHSHLEQAVLNQDELRWKAMVDWEWTRLIVAGAWFTPLKESLDRFGVHLSELVSGEVDLEYSTGRVFVIGVKSAMAPYYWNVREEYEYFLNRIDVESLWSLLDIPEALRGGRGLV